MLQQRKPPLPKQCMLPAQDRIITEHPPHSCDDNIISKSKPCFDNGIQSLISSETVLSPASGSLERPANPGLDGISILLSAPLPISAARTLESSANSRAARATAALTRDRRLQIASTKNRAGKSDALSTPWIDYRKNAAGPVNLLGLSFDDDGTARGQLWCREKLAAHYQVFPNGAASPAAAIELGNICRADHAEGLYTHYSSLLSF